VRQVVFYDNRVTEKMVAHALQHPYEEICGVLEGKYLSPEGAISRGEDFIVRVTAYYPVQNTAKDKLAGFTMDPYETQKAWDSILSNGSHVVGCFHSHPLWSSKFSSIDLREAKMQADELLWLIYGKKDARVSAFVLNRDRDNLTELEVNV
jgi:proteasome lid subunit RPN8/RPN11